MLPFKGVWIPENKAIKDVSSVGDRDGEDCCLALLDVCHAVRRVQIDAVNHVHECSGGQIGLDCWVFVGLCCHSDISQFIAIRLVHRRRTDSKIEPDVFSALEEDGGFWHDCGVVICEEQGRSPVLWHARNVQSEGIGHEVLWSRCGVVHGHVVDGLFTRFDDVVEGFTLLELNIHLSCKNVGVANREAVVVCFLAALVGVGPCDVGTATKVVRERWRHADTRLRTCICPEFVACP